MTVVSDGYITVPGDVVTAGADPAARAAILRRLPTAIGGVKAFANIPVVQNDRELVIFDVGGGAKYQSTEGALVTHLLAAGIAPRAITKVVLTHAHPDHIWGTRGYDGQLTFPNATYYVGQAEWDFWMDPDFLTRMPAGLHDFAGARAARSTRSGIGSHSSKPAMRLSRACGPSTRSDTRRAICLSSLRATTGC